MSLIKTEESFTPDDLFAGHVQPVVADSEIIVSGAGALARGTVLGKITTGGKLQTIDSAAVDGSQTIHAILAEDVDATSADVTAPVYYTGEYNESKLAFGGTDTADTHRTAARKIGIFFKTAVSA